MIGVYQAMLTVLVYKPARLEYRQEAGGGHSIKLHQHVQQLIRTTMLFKTRHERLSSASECECEAGHVTMSGQSPGTQQSGTCRNWCRQSGVFKKMGQCGSSCCGMTALHRWQLAGK